MDLNSEILNEFISNSNSTNEEEANNALISASELIITDTVADDDNDFVAATEPDEEASNSNQQRSEQDPTEDQEAGTTTSVKQVQLALGRIKTIMKLDPDLALASKESVFLITKATELFIDYISKESYKFTSQGSRKTIQKKDIDQAVNTNDALCFLDAALD